MGRVFLVSPGSPPKKGLQQETGAECGNPPFIFLVGDLKFWTIKQFFLPTYLLHLSTRPLSSLLMSSLTKGWPKQEQREAFFGPTVA